MNFSTIFFIDSFLKKQTDQNLFIKSFLCLLDSLTKEKISSFVISKDKEILKDYFSIPIIYLANFHEQELFLQKKLPKHTIVISDNSDFLSLCTASGYSCAGFSHTKEFLPVTYCFEDLFSLTYDYLKYIHKRCQNLPITIAETKLLFIREFTMADMPQLFALYQKEANLKYVFQREPDYALLCDKFSSYISHVYSFYDYGLWAVVLKETGKIIGEFGLQCNEIDFQQEIELGYMLHPDFQGKGLACQAIRAIFRYARDTLSFNRIVAVIHPQNIASICVAKKCGMHFEKEFLFHNEVFHLYVILVQKERFFSPKSSSRQVIKKQIYQKYQQNPDTSVYGKRYSSD